MTRNNNNSTGYVFVNLGTPNSPSKADVKTYLDEFLMDPFVIDIPKWWRWLLVKGIILNTRPKKSAHAYQSIWTDRGSPLKYHLEDLKQKIKTKLDGPVFIAMRYGQPSFSQLLSELSQYPELKKLKIIMLYPQWAWASSGSTEFKLGQMLKGKYEIEWVNPFYNHADFINAWAERIRSTEFPKDNPHYLFSFHGIPERQLAYANMECSKTCLKSTNCCQTASPQVIERCYRAQCFITANKIAEALKLDSKQYTVSFQSRLGRTPWLQPFTDLWIEKQKQDPVGPKNVVVVCPSFVSDCLETLEEIGMRAKEDFESGAGDRTLTLVKSLNSESYWIEALSKITTGESTYSEFSRVQNSLH
jgi:ferrochelatase